MNKIISFAFVVAIAISSSVSFGQTTHQESSDVLANRVRSQAYSRLANMGIEMPPKSQHSRNYQATNACSMLEGQAAPVVAKPTTIESKAVQSGFLIWNPLSWFRGNESDLGLASRNAHQGSRSNTIHSQAYARSLSSFGRTRVGVSGTGGSSIAVSNVNGRIAVNARCVVDGKPQRFQLQGNKTEIRNQLGQLPAEIRQRILESLEH